MKYAASIVLALALLLGSGAARAQSVSAPQVPAPLQATATLQSFDWQQQWGAIDFASNNDPLIPAAQLPPKKAIKNAVLHYGISQTPANLSLVATYGIDFNSDGVEDIVLDGSAYYRQFANSASPICTAGYGCYLTLYVVSPPTDMITQPAASSASASTQVCPATADQNVQCISSCAATVQNCPGLFQYNMRAVFDNQVLGWSFITASDFQTLAAGLTMYRLISATNPVLAVTVNYDKCYFDELTANNNRCIKYYQYDPNLNGGTFSDLYTYQEYTGGEFVTCFTTAPFAGRTVNGPANQGKRGDLMGAGYGHKLPSGGTLDIQFAKFTYRDINGVDAAPAFTTFHIVNNSANSYFVPANTDYEFSSFINAKPTGVTITPPMLQFTAWIGDTVCPSVQGSQICDGSSGDDQIGGVSKTIAAQRFCQSSTSAYMPCEMCVEAAAKVNGVGWPSDWQQGCSFQQQCAGAACCSHGQPVPVNSLDECAGVIASHCVAGGTLISLPNGRTKALNEIKPGEIVLGFDSPKGKLKPVKVKMLAVTEKEHTVLINGTLALTENHAFVTQKGAAIQAGKLKLGDKVALADGKTMKIESVQSVPETGTVYNLQLETGKGFIAGGVRVMGMSNTETVAKK